MKSSTTQGKIEDTAGAFADLRLGHNNVLFSSISFQQVLYLERKRRERSMRPMLLLLIDLTRIPPQLREEAGGTIARILPAVTRETDVKGWYSENRVLGVIFTELNTFDEREIVKKLKEGLESRMLPALVRKLVFSVHVYPRRHEDGRQELVESPVLYPDVNNRYGLKRGAVLVKRLIDIVGSMAGLLIFSPLFVIIPILIRATSPGPVLFKQERMGLYGKKFTFLKFRTMYWNNDSSVHQEYVRKLIAGNDAAKDDETKKNNGRGSPEKVFKIMNDKRITPLGQLLRKTSMDELPQFLNVLKGDMSLVGPRPPIPYEVQNYDLWHLSRVVEVKPGITGLWQVKGRSSTSFDEMVRLDITYVRQWTIWLDLKIIVMTPLAVLRGKGAY